MFSGKIRRFLGKMRRFQHFIYEGFYATEISNLPYLFRNGFQKSVVKIAYYATGHSSI